MWRLAEMATWPSFLALVHPARSQRWRRNVAEVAAYPYLLRRRYCQRPGMRCWTSVSLAWPWRWGCWQTAIPCRSGRKREREGEWNGVGRRVGIRKGLRGMGKGQERRKRREEKHFNIYLSYTLSKRNVGIGCRCGVGVGVMVVAAAVIWLRHACVWRVLLAVTVTVTETDCYSNCYFYCINDCDIILLFIAAKCSSSCLHCYLS